jgi:hypothetical protein
LNELIEYDKPHNSSISCCLGSSCYSNRTLASAAFAYDSSKTITKQINKQKQVISGEGSFGSQDASNCIAVLNGANACRQQGTDAVVIGPGT